MELSDMRQTIDRVIFHHLKHLNDLDIDFIGHEVTGIFGVNGCGKSTILHAIACFYRSNGHNGETNYFTRFFKTVNNEAWPNSRMTVFLTEDGRERTIHYEKRADRWTPRMAYKPVRNTYYIGIDTCVPAIEKEPLTRTSFKMTAIGRVPNQSEVLCAFSNIMGRSYDSAVYEAFLSKKYSRVSLQNQASYSSLSMGAGEQRLMEILTMLYQLPENALLLIDELDLTLHTSALNRLVNIMVRRSQQKKLQIIFTSHREELARREDINVRHIWTPANTDKTFCIEHTTAECISRLTGEMEKEYEVYVEDELAACIVKDILKDRNILHATNVVKYGVALNAFTIAAGWAQQKEDTSNRIILTDGDVHKTDNERTKIIESRIKGSDPAMQSLRDAALQNIKQFNLPEGEQPEHFVWTILKTKQGRLADLANRIDQLPDNKHGYLSAVAKLYGEDMNIFYRDVVAVVKSDSGWKEYVKPLTDWVNSHTLKQ